MAERSPLAGSATILNSRCVVAVLGGLVGEPAHDRRSPSRRRAARARGSTPPTSRSGSSPGCAARRSRRARGRPRIRARARARRRRDPGLRDPRARTGPPRSRRVAPRGAAGRELEHVLLEHGDSRRAGRGWRATSTRRRGAPVRPARRRRSRPSRRTVNQSASSAISVPASTSETGHVAFARSAKSWNCASSTPGTSPSVLSVMRVIRKPSGSCSSRTRAVVRRSVGRMPGLRELVGERHREAARVRRADELLGVGGGLALLDARLQRERAFVRAAPEPEPAAALWDGPAPARFGRTGDSKRHECDYLPCMTRAAPDLGAVRRRFSSLQGDFMFFDAPGGSQVPDEVGEAMRAVLREASANIGRRTRRAGASGRSSKAPSNARRASSAASRTRSSSAPT